MSDSSSSPVTTSMRKLVDARTRSRSGRLRKPSVDRPSSSSGAAEVKPPNDKRDRGSRNGLPGGEGAADSLLELGRTDARDALFGHEVANGRLASSSGAKGAPSIERRAAGTRRRAPGRREMREGERHGSATSPNHGGSGRELADLPLEVGERQRHARGIAPDDPTGCVLAEGPAASRATRVP